MGRFASVLCFVLLIAGSAWWWRAYHAPNPYDGSVHRDTTAQTGTAIGRSQSLGEVQPTPPRSDLPRSLDRELYDSTAAESSAEETTAQDNTHATGLASLPQAPQAQAADPETQSTQSDLPKRTPEKAVYEQPASNGELPPTRSTAEGPYQWYRQGDLTYRIDTRTGASCIIYATMEEWRKPLVYRHGCRTH